MQARWSAVRTQCRAVALVSVKTVTKRRTAQRYIAQQQARRSLAECVAT